MLTSSMRLTARDRPNYNERLLARRNCVGERGVARLVGEIPFAGEESEEGAARRVSWSLS